MFASIHGAYVSGLREACGVLGPACAASAWPWFSPDVRTLCEVAPLPANGSSAAQSVGSVAIGRARGQGQA